MKNYIMLSIFMVASTITIYAQAPKAFNYTGIALDTKGKSISNKNISVQVSIEDGGGGLFTETHDVSTDNNGFFNIKIGGKNLEDDPTGSLDEIDWTLPTAKYLTVGISLDGGMSYEYLDPVQLLTTVRAKLTQTASIEGLGDME